ncbi:hypoxia induced protein conserved region domain-containing protein [Ditylenchus destructor]|nr:hypoxia induced protein conserved region domain-containing protein [Ditylenchus destructor]
MLPNCSAPFRRQIGAIEVPLESPEVMEESDGPSVPPPQTPVLTSDCPVTISSLRGFCSHHWSQSADEDAPFNQSLAAINDGVEDAEGDARHAENRRTEKRHAQNNPKMATKQPENAPNTVNEKFFTWKKVGTKANDKPIDEIPKSKPVGEVPLAKSAGDVSQDKPIVEEKRAYGKKRPPVVPPASSVVGGSVFSPTAVFGESSAFKDEMWKKSAQKMKENPILPLGLAGVTYCLFGMARSMIQRDSMKANKYMRARVAIQGFTALTLFAGALWTYWKRSRIAELEFAEMATAAKREAPVTQE